ncbi:MAG: CHASE3 domain-containing protein [Cyclonatronaceae bacterium]
MIALGATRKAENTQSLIRSYNVIESTTQLWSNLQDAETGQRGYLLTGNFDYLQPYNNSLWEIDLELLRLQSLTDDNPKQLAIIHNSLVPLIGKKRTELELSITQYQRSGSEAALNIIKTDQGKLTMDSLRTVISTIKALEEELQKDRTSELEKAYYTYNMISFAGLFIIGFTMLAAVITIRKKSKENRQLMALEVANNKKLIRLNEKEVKLRMDISKFMGNAAHDLRSPLNAINSINELLKMDSEQFSEEHRQFLDFISESTAQMASLINNLLEVNKFEEGTHAVTPEHVDVHAMLKTLLFGHETSMYRKNIKLKTDIDFEGQLVYTDKGIFVQIADNLISNAIKYSPPGKRVVVSLKEDREGFRLTVTDQGAGIPESDMPRLYKRYQTLSTRPTAGEKSTGLGLSIVKELVDLIGGTIDVKSIRDEGTTFTVLFPYIGNSDPVAHEFGEVQVQD